MAATKAKTKAVKADVVENKKEYKKGDILHLNNETLYVSPYSYTVKDIITGDYFVFDGYECKGRMRICCTKDGVGKFPLSKYVIGWVAINV